MNYPGQSRGTLRVWGVHLPWAN